MSRFHFRLRAVVQVLACLPLLVVAQAAPLTIINPSFELLPTTTPPGLALPEGTRLTSRASLCPTITPAGFPCEGFGGGWTTADVFGDSNGTMNTLASQFNSPVPDGEYTGYSNGTPFYQILGDTLQATFVYTLSVFVGERNIIGNDPMGDSFSENQGYYVELAVDNNGTYGGRTVLARSSFLKACCPGIPASFNAPDAGSPGHGNFIEVSFSYTPGIGAPLGKNLMISFGTPGVSANFDMVTLNADPTVPEPGTIAMVLGGIGLLALQRRKAMRRQ